MVFIVGPGNNMFEWFGHAALYVRSGSEVRGVSNGGDVAFEKGVRGFLSHYTGKGRTVSVFILKTTPEQDRAMVSFIKKNPDAATNPDEFGAGLMVRENCAKAVANVLQAGGVIEEGETADGTTTFLQRPGELENSLREGELSDNVGVVLEFDPEADQRAQQKLDELGRASILFRSLGNI
jgi:hypothetical protein